MVDKGTSNIPSPTAVGRKKSEFQLNIKLAPESVLQGHGTPELSHNTGGDSADEVGETTMGKPESIDESAVTPKSSILSPTNVKEIRHRQAVIGGTKIAGWENTGLPFGQVDAIAQHFGGFTPVEETAEYYSPPRSASDHQSMMAVFQAVGFQPDRSRDRNNAAKPLKAATHNDVSSNALGKKISKRK